MEHALAKQQQTDSSKIATLDLPELYNCVHCGLCLNQCPTYRALRLEPESPRGRIHLVKAAAEGRIELNERFKEHIYLCLLCRACETACPSGVQYGRIAEAAREHLGPPGSKLARAVQNFAFTRLLPHPKRLRVLASLLRFYQRSGLQKLVRPLLPVKLGDMDAMLPSIPKKFFEPKATTLAAVGARRAQVAMLDGCVMPLLFGDVNAATVRVLQRNGCDIVFPEDQTCCGALNIHNGEQNAAKEMARRNIDAFLAANVDAIIVNAAGCGAAMKEYSYLLRDDPSYGDKAKRFSMLVKDAGEFLCWTRTHGKTGTAGNDGNLPRPLPSRPRPARPRPAPQAVASNSGARTQRNDRRRPLLRQRRYLQHYSPRHVAPFASRKNASHRGDESRRRRSAQSRLHAAASIWRARVWTESHRVSLDGSARPLL